MKRRIYLVPSLIAAGFMPSKSDAAAVSGTVEKKSPQSMFDRLRVSHVYTLAGHSSHSSHASHASHVSSAGGSYLPRADDGGTYTEPAPNYAPKPLYQAPAPVYAPPPPPIYSPPPAAVYVAPAPAPSLAPAPLKVLPGNTDRFRRIVIQVQTGLVAFGYYPGPVTGQVDAATKAGLSKMQDAYNLKVTGTITPEVLTALGISAN
jgi:His-Xaa-Ser repeat protein HxsA